MGRKANNAERHEEQQGEEREAEETGAKAPGGGGSSRSPRGELSGGEQLSHPRPSWSHDLIFILIPTETHSTSFGLVFFFPIVC